MSSRARRRNRSYIRKIWYLRHFLYLLKVYRIYLRWKYRERQRDAIKWRNYAAIPWKIFTLRWNAAIYLPKMYTIVIYHYYDCQMTMTCLISKEQPLSFFLVDDFKTDKLFVISHTQDTLVWRKNLYALGRCKCLLLKRNFT